MRDAADRTNGRTEIKFGKIQISIDFYFPLIV
jgi:hypothetical protein